MDSLLHVPLKSVILKPPTLSISFGAAKSLRFCLVYVVSQFFPSTLYLIGTSHLSLQSELTSAAYFATVENCIGNLVSLPIGPIMKLA